MNPDEIHNAWNSPRNTPPTAKQHKLALQFARQMIRRRRFRAIWLTNTFVWLTLVTMAAFHTIAAGKFHLAQEWAMFPLLIVPWIFAIYFFQRYLKSPGSVAEGELSVADSFRAALDSNRTEQSHLKKVGLLFVVMIPISGISVQQLYAVGKISSKDLICMAIFFSAIFAVSGAGIAARYFGRIKPQERKLGELLADMANGR